jgi:hypothetical protein
LADVETCYVGGVCEDLVDDIGADGPNASWETVSSPRSRIIDRARTSRAALLLVIAIFLPGRSLTDFTGEVGTTTILLLPGLANPAVTAK